MALVWLDRVMEETSSTGTGSLTLGGAVTGYRTFAGVGNGNTCYYSVFAVDAAGNPSGVWEAGLGTWATGGTLARTTVHANSSGTQTALDLAAGTKRVALTLNANHATTIPVVNGGTGLTALGSALQVLRVNSGGTALEYGTLSTGLTVGTTAITSGTSGRLLYDAAGVVGETAAIAYATSGTHLTLTAQAATNVPLAVVGHGSQSGNLVEVRSSGGTVLSVNSSGNKVTCASGDLEFDNTSTGVVKFNYFNTGLYMFKVDSAGVILRESNAVNALRVYTQASPPSEVGWTAYATSTLFNQQFALRWCEADVWYSGTADVGVRRPSAGVLAAYDADAGSDVGWGFQRKSSTTNQRDVARLTASWADSTDATRKGRLVANAYDTAARECLRLEASGSAAMVGLYGTAATAQYATTGTVTGYTGGGGTALTHSDTFTGNTGSTAYTISDIVRALKLLGVMAA